MIKYLLHLSLLGLAYGWCPWLFWYFNNPSKPEFLVHNIYLQMSPNTDVGTWILQVNATDQDANDTLWYSLEAFPYNDYLKLDSTKGILQANKSFADLGVTLLEFTITVKDRQDIDDLEMKSDEAKVIIELVGLEG